jgi:hypothetical protein
VDTTTGTLYVSLPQSGKWVKASGGGTPAGVSGSIQYNNSGVFAGSAATIDATGNISAAKGTFGASTTQIILGPNPANTVNGAIWLTDNTGVIVPSATNYLVTRDNLGTYLNAFSGSILFLQVGNNDVGQILFNAGTPALIIGASTTEINSQIFAGQITANVFVRTNAIEDRNNTGSFFQLATNATHGITAINNSGANNFVPFSTQGQLGQTGNLQEWQSSTGAVLAAINSGGALTLTSAAPTVAAGQISLGATTATTATAGSNGDVPAQVVGYLIANLAGTAVKIPYYNT